MPRQGRSRSSARTRLPATPGWKTKRKRTWLTAFRAGLAARDPAIPAMVLGDLNVLEPDHRPHYPFFVPFEYDFYRALSAEHGLTDAFRHLHPAAAEYSWVGRIGDGYRCDHAFCSAILTPASTCTNPRTDGLSDHSALTAGLTAQPPPALECRTRPPPPHPPHFLICRRSASPRMVSAQAEAGAARTMES